MKFILIVALVFSGLLSQKRTYVLKDDERVIESGQERYWSSDYIWILEGDLIIQKGARLEIEPGTTIKFRPNMDKSKTGKVKNKAEVIVMGELLAEGRASLNKFITFTSAAEVGSERSNDWYGIVIYKNAAGANTRIKNVNIQYAYRGISCIGSSPFISNNRILYSENSAIYLVRSNAIIESNQIQSNGFAGIEVRTNSTPKIYQNNIIENDYGVMIYDSSEPSLGNKSNNRGENSISGNYTYDIYNGSSKDIMAINNKWTSDSRSEVAQKIFDSNNSNKYGRVVYLPMSTITSAELQRQNLQDQIATNPVASNAGAASSSRTNRNTTPARRNTTPTRQPQQQTPPPQSNNTEKQTNTNTQEKTTTKTEDNTAKDDEVVTEAPQTKPAETKPEEVEEAVVDLYEQSKNNPFLTFALDVGSGQVLQKGVPEYGGAVSQLNIRGRVFVKLIIENDGTVFSAQILRSDNKLLEEGALEAARKYKFTPGTVNGVPVRFTMNDMFIVN